MTTTLTLEFPFVADKPTINGRIYPRDTLVKAIQKAQETIKDRRMFGELNSDKYLIRVSEVSHLITGLSLEGDTMKADVEILPTPAGNTLSKLHAAMTPLQLLPMGYGDYDAEKCVVTGYSISTIHVHTKDGED